MRLPNKEAVFKVLPFVLAAAILALVAVIAVRESSSLLERKEDLPPVIEFTWTPLGPVDLREMTGHLTLKDDHALDFSTYRMRILEIGKTLDLPIEGLVGKQYEQNVSLPLYAGNPVFLEKKRLTLEFTVADDRGQRTTLTKVILLK